LPLWPFILVAVHLRALWKRETNNAVIREL
jgi:hypothetical protein